MNRPRDIEVELFGLPRQAAGVDRAAAAGADLGAVVADLARRFPGLAAACFADGRLRPGCLACVNGGRFVTDPATPLAPGDRLLLLSADAGG